MAILQQLIGFLKSVFGENKKADIPTKQQIKRLEQQLRQMQPPLYKNGELLPAFGELIFLLYTHTTPFFRLLNFMAPAENIHIKNRIYDMLIQTGYSPNDKVKLASLSYESRKAKLEKSNNIQRDVESQTHTLEELIHVLRSSTFIQIEDTLKKLELFYDLCTFNFIGFLKIFNPTFDSLDPQNSFAPAPIDKATNFLLDLYFITSAFQVNASLARAVMAISSSVHAEKKLPADEVVVHIKKIAAILTKVLNNETLKACILIAKDDASFRPDTAFVKSAPLADYASRLRSRFQSEEQRIKVELQDRQLERERKELFGDLPLQTLASYNEENNKILKQDSAVSFLWITPMQIIKTFLIQFFEEQVRGLLNDIILEGFFNNPEQKTDFSSTVYACTDTQRILNAFEQSFAKGAKNDIGLILSYVNDGRKDPEFSRNLAVMVNNVNAEAKNFVQTQVSYFYDLYRYMLLLSDDARKSVPEVISNIKFLFTSSRNRSRVDFLEQTLPQWAAFLLVMKNYAVIGQVELPRKESRQAAE
ncbi:hypothetical protein H0R92_06700 [Treponema sp. OMZ 840]|uniref:hypothetical protein n=1 Tax=Treponema sp. OMZ 840 TaxID=244313 RepID=UPI003D8AD5BA